MRPWYIAAMSAALMLGVGGGIQSAKATQAMKTSKTHSGPVQAHNISPLRFIDAGPSSLLQR